MSIAGVVLPQQGAVFGRRLHHLARRSASVRKVMSRPFASNAPLALRPGWLPTGYLAQGRAFHTASLLADGTVLVTGGYDNNDAPLATCEIFDLTTSRWRPTGRMATARGHHAASVLPNGEVLVVGGTTRGISDVDHTTATAEIYSPVTGTWRAGEPLRTSRAFHTAAALLDGSVLVAGGYHGAHNQVGDAERFDPTSGQWHVAGTLEQARAGHTATLLENGHLLVAGGESGGIYELFPLGGAELFDPGTETWTGVGDSAEPPFTGHSAARLQDGRVLVSGGLTGLDVDPAGSRPWTALDTAGWGPNPHPGSSSWLVYTPAMPNARFLHTEALLADGTVLAIGGMFGGAMDGRGATGLSLVDQYTPGTPGRPDERGAWTSAPSMLEPRAAHTSTMLQDGSVLVSGGIDFVDGGVLDSAELYTPLPGLSGCAIPFAMMALVFGAGAAILGLTRFSGRLP